MTGYQPGMATEDALTLALLLAQPECTPKTLPSFFRACDAARRPRAERIQKTSYSLGEIYQLDEEDAPAEGQNPYESESLVTILKCDLTGEAVGDRIQGRREFSIRWDVLR